MIPLLFDVFGLPWPCQNYPRGCREILIESELENHEINCVFRLVNCVDNFCTNGAIDKKIVFKDALDHFENDYETSGPNFQPAIKVEGDKNSFVFQVYLANLAFSLHLTPRKMEIQENRSKLTFFVVGCLNGEVPRFWKHNFNNCIRF